MTCIYLYYILIYYTYDIYNFTILIYYDILIYAFNILQHLQRPFPCGKMMINQGIESGVPLTNQTQTILWPIL